MVARSRQRQRQPSVAPGRFAPCSRNSAYRLPGAISGDSPGMIFKAAVGNAMLPHCNLARPLRDPLCVVIESRRLHLMKVARLRNELPDAAETLMRDGGRHGDAGAR